MAEDETIANSLDNEFDDADLFADFDLDSPDTGSRKPAGPAKAVATNLLNFSSSFTSKAAGEVARSMPRTSMLAGELKRIGNDMADIRREFTTELRPTVKSVQQALHKSLPMAKKFIPKGLYDKVEQKLGSYEADSDEWRPASKEERQKEEITSTIAEIFAAQEQTRMGEATDSKAELLVDRVLTNKRHKDSIAALTAIDKKLLYQTEFTRTTQAAWMKKMLELKYIHVFTAKEILSANKMTVSLLETKLEEIKHNTGLPDVVKTKLLSSSDIMGHTRAKALGKISDKAGDYFGAVRKNMLEFGKKYGSGALKTIKEQALGLSGAMDMASDLGADASDLGGSPAGTVGGFIGQFGGRKIADVAAPFISEIEDIASNIKETAYYKGKSIKDQLTSSGNPLLEFVATFIPEHQEVRTIENTLLDNPTEPLPFDRATRQSIVEIIPGFLSSMDKSLRDIVTGTDTEARMFDVTTRTIRDVSETREAAISRAFGNETTRAQASLSAVGSLRGAFMYRAGGTSESKEETFKKIQRDIFKFVTNSAVKNRQITPSSIKAFAESEAQTPEEFGDDYITDTFNGLAAPKATAQVLVAAIYDGDLIDHSVLNEIGRAMAGALEAENWKDIIPQFLDAHGAWGMFREMGALDADNNVTDKFLEDVLMNVSTERFEKETAGTAETFSRIVDTRREQREYMRENITEKYVPKFLRDLADKVATSKRLGMLRNLAKPISNIKETAGEVSPVDIGDVTAKAGEVGQNLADRAASAGNVAKDRIKAMAPAEAIKGAGEQMSEAVGGLVEKIDLLTEEALRKQGDPDKPVKVEMVADPSQKGMQPVLSEFHQDFQKYVEYRQTFDAMLLEAVQGGGDPAQGPAKRSLMGRLIGGTGKAGGAVLRMYGNIYGSALKGGAHVIGKGFDFGKAVIPGLGKGMFDLAGKGIGAYASMYSSMFGSITGMFKRGPKKDVFVDVYRKGEIELGNPLATAKEQRKYGILANSGAMLQSSADIVEPLIHSDSGETLITQADIDHGLVDQYNKSLSGGTVSNILGTRGGKFAGLLGKGMSGALDLITGGAKGYKDIVMGMLGLGGKGIEGIFNMFSGGKKKYEPITDRLDNIIELLENRLPKGSVFGDTDADGDVEGSYKDQMSDIAARAKRRKERRTARAAAVGGRSGKRREGVEGEDEDDDDSDIGIAESVLGVGAIGSGLMKSWRFANAVKSKGLKGALGDTKLGRSAKWLKGTRIGKFAGRQLTRIPGMKKVIPRMGGKGLGKALSLGKLALLEGGIGMIDTLGDKAKAEDITSDILKRQAEISDVYGPLANASGFAGLSRAFNLRKTAEELGKGNILGAAWEGTKGVFGSAGEAGKLVGANISVGADAIDEASGPSDLQQLRKALLGMGIIRDPIGWGDWVVEDWNKLADLPSRDLSWLTRDDKFSKDDQNAFVQMYRAAIKREQRKKRAREEREAAAKVAETTAVKPVGAKGAPVGTEAAKPASAADREVAKAMTDRTATEKQTAEETVAMQRRLVELQEQALTAFSELTRSVNKVAGNTDALADIKKASKETAEESKKNKVVPVPIPTEKKESKVVGSTINLQQIH